MLKTPLGEIIVYIDDTESEYTAVAVHLDHRCDKLNGRYYICINHENDGKPHVITCRIRGYTPNEKDGVEDGEDLLLMSFFNGSAKLSIGVEFDYCGKYDYEAVHLQDGMQFRVFPQTKTKYFANTIMKLFTCRTVCSSESFRKRKQSILCLVLRGSMTAMMKTSYIRGLAQIRH